MSDVPSLEDEGVETLVAEATDSFLERVQRGERADVEEHARRYPAIETILRDLLPVVQLMQVIQPKPAAVRDTTGAPSKLGDFQLIREIGRGGMGVVYEAEQISLGRRVALKVLPLASALDPRQLQRFRLEAQAAAHLHHSHIVPIYSVGCERGEYYYAMQYVEGQSLDEVIYKLQQQDTESYRPAPPPLPKSHDNSETAAEATPAGSPATADTRAAATVQSIRSSHYFSTVATMGIQAADALDYAHGMGVVHRDIKPGNLLLDTQGTIYVTDFGLARLQDNPGMTMTGDLVGTLRYMSPEQAQAQRGVVDHRTDIYSLGATLYELLTLNPAFDSTERASLLRQIIEDEPVLPRRWNPSLPIDLETIVLKALAKEPEKRYQAARELAEDLKRFLDHRPILARRPTLVERAAKWSRRHRSLVIAAIVILLFTAVGLGVSTAVIAQHQAAVQDLNKELKKAYAQLDKQQRDIAAAFQLSSKVLNHLVDAVHDEDVADRPELQSLRRDLLSIALKYYEDFSDQRGDDQSLLDQSLLTELANSRARAAAILAETGSRTDALNQLDKAQHLVDLLIRNKSIIPDETLSDIYRRFRMLRGGRDLMLLSHKGVQDDLQLNADQVKAVSVIWENRHIGFGDDQAPISADQWKDRFQELSVQEKALTDLLLPEQAHRLRQIALQRRGADAFNDPEIVKHLQLTDEQQKRIRSLRDARRPPPPGGRIFDPHPDDRQRNDNRRNTRDQVLHVLTDAQKQKWQELTGPPFKGSFRGGPW